MMPPEPEKSTDSTQKSGIFGLPLELFIEIFSHLTDHRRFVRENYYGREMYTHVKREHAERSIVIRKFTMTCRQLRNLLFPLLWMDTEGFISHVSYDYIRRRGGEGSHLYAQCVYLASNPIVSSYVRTFSVCLHLSYAPEDLIVKFVECLVQLPNLKTLEILGAGPRAPISKALESKSAVFPSILELRISPACHYFIKNCPNLENLIFTRSLDMYATSTLMSHGEGLKRIAGLSVYRGCGMEAVSNGCPNLQEVSIIGTIRSGRGYVQLLRKLQHLVILDANLDQGSEPRDPVWEEARATWRRELFSILKDSPSTGRKILRWKVVQRRLLPQGAGRTYDVMESKEIEITPDMPC